MTEVFRAFFRDIIINNALNAVIKIGLIKAYFNIKIFLNAVNIGAQSIKRKKFIEIFRHDKRNLKI